MYLCTGTTMYYNSFHRTGKKLQYRSSFTFVGNQAQSTCTWPIEVRYVLNVLNVLCCVVLTRTVSEALKLLLNSVDPAGTETLKQTNKSHAKVHAVINHVEPIETGIGLLHERQQPRNKAKHASNLPAGNSLQDDGIPTDGDGQNTFLESKGGVNSKQKEVKE